MKRQHYEIRVEGHLGGSWSDWFEGLSIRSAANDEGELVHTVLSGPMDQAALHGVLIKIRDLGIPLVAVNRVNER